MARGRGFWSKSITDAEYVDRWRANCVIDANGCWLFQGFIHRNGYGDISYRGKRHKAHRAMYLAAHGPIPANHDVCHTCDTRHCINQAHLWVGTRKQNAEDMTAKGRHYNTVKTICVRGHALTPENIYTNPQGARICRTCMKMRGKPGWTPARPKGRKRDQPGYRHPLNTPARE